MLDFYMNIDNVYNRLKNWYIEHGNLIVAFDFDDTIYNSHNNPNANYDMVIDLLKRCRSYSTLICYTARSYNELNICASYMDKIGLGYDYINTDYEGKELYDYGATDFPISRKLYYNILLDDKSGLESAYIALNRVISDIENGNIKSKNT